MTVDLLGDPVLEDPQPGALTPAERKRALRRQSEQAKGYAWKPGTGPAGETCRTCLHPVRRSTGCRIVIKCGANRGAWTRSVRSDIRLKSPACQKWEPRSA